LRDLPRSLTKGVFTGPHFAGVTGDLSDLTGMVGLKFLTLSNSPKITGELDSLKAATAVLEHIDLASSPFVHGSIEKPATTVALPATLKYANFASAEKISGKIDYLPATLEYANFRAARFLTGDLKTIAGQTNNGDCTIPNDGSVIDWAGRPANCKGSCNLVELNLRNSVGTKISGFLENGLKDVKEKIACECGVHYQGANAAAVAAGNAAAAAAAATNRDKCGMSNVMNLCMQNAAHNTATLRRTNCCNKGNAVVTESMGLFNACPKLKWLDIGDSYVKSGGTGVSKKDFNVNGDRCVRTKMRYATDACTP